MEEYGLPPGSAAPELDLPDLDGRTQTLQSLTGPAGLLLQFSRPAW